MNKGSTRVTIRIGDELLQAVRDEVAKKTSSPSSGGSWTASEWIIQAIVDKLNHARRSRGQEEKVTHLVTDENAPRVISFE